MAEWAQLGQLSGAAPLPGPLRMLLTDSPAVQSKTAHRRVRSVRMQTFAPKYRAKYKKCLAFTAVAGAGGEAGLVAGLQQRGLAGLVEVVALAVRDGGHQLGDVLAVLPARHLHHCEPTRTK